MVEFQINNSLTADGIVGEQTWKKLHATNASPNLDESEGFTILRKGRRGDDVKLAQERLIALGYNCGKSGADRIFGPSTFNAVIEFQRLNGLVIDGTIGAETYSVLFSANAKPADYADADTQLVKFGSRGTEVTNIQNRLIELGYSCGKFGADGVFGNSTHNAVIQFQRLNKLITDGIVGPDTKTKLFSNNAVRFTADNDNDDSDTLPPYYGDLVDYISIVIRINEVGSETGGYEKVNANDNGSLSIGISQWHGTRAYDLLMDIKNANPTRTSSILSGTSLYMEIGNSASKFSDRILNSAEKAAVSELISTDFGKKKQDELFKANIIDYINVGKNTYRITDSACLIYFCDMLHQRGSGAVRGFVDQYGNNGSLSGMTLIQIHAAAIIAQPEKEPRRTQTKKRAEQYVESGEVYDKLIQIAMNEQGYENERGYSKYGAWYGQPSAYWCNCFVSWCADKAGILDVLIPKGSYTETTKTWFNNRSAFKKRSSGYIPKKGDCIYFLFPNDSSASRTVNHIALVREDSDGSQVKTIEGNLGKSGNSNIRQVRAEEYNINNSSIVGYGSVRTIADKVN